MLNQHSPPTRSPAPPPPPSPRIGLFLRREHPNKTIASFSGSLEVVLKPGGGAVDSKAKPAAAAGRRGQEGGAPTAVKEPITPDNLLLRGTVLRNTKVGWGCGGRAEGSGYSFVG